MMQLTYYFHTKYNNSKLNIVANQPTEQIQKLLK